MTKDGVMDDLLKRLSEAQSALCSLTPGGSEYANDPAACVAYVRKVREQQHDVIVKFATDNKQLRAEIERLREDGEAGFEQWMATHFINWKHRNRDETVAAMVRVMRDCWNAACRTPACA